MRIAVMPAEEREAFIKALLKGYRKSQGIKEDGTINNNDILSNNAAASDLFGNLSGKGDWYQKWYARYLCREWARTHRGVMPQKVELFKLTYKMPSPEMVAKQGWYVPAKLLHDTGREERQYTEKCANAIHGQLPNFIRERHGIEPLDEKGFKAWVKSKKKAWDKRLEPPAPKGKSETKTTPTGRVGSAARAARANEAKASK